MDRKKLGNAGEDLACRYLIRNGYEILERNKSYPKLCELDIIAKKKNKIYFVEVKTRMTNDYGLPSEAVDRKKIENIRKGIALYRNENSFKDYQIDILAITIKPEIHIEHFRNVS